MTKTGAPVVLRTLADHRPFTLSAVCQACDRSVAADHQALAGRYGSGILLEVAAVRAVWVPAGSARAGWSWGAGPDR